jgi:hypothetical protein
LLRFAQELSQRGWELGDLEVVIARCQQSFQDAIAEGLVGGS